LHFDQTSEVKVFNNFDIINYHSQYTITAKKNYQYSVFATLPRVSIKLIGDGYVTSQSLVHDSLVAGRQPPLF